MKPEKQLLIDELLSGPEPEARRQSTLSAGARLLQRRRWKRRAFESFSLIALFAAAGYSAHLLLTPGPRMAASLAPSMTPPPSTDARYLTDDELLALFPKTPVAIATVGSRKILIFPRPGDEEKFVGHF